MLYGLLKEYAQKNRNNETLAEGLLWGYLRAGKMGVVFKRQHIIGPYIADFCCLTERLVIEVDGGYHQLPDQQESDVQREAWLYEHGFTVLRFSNEEIYNNIESVLEIINKELQRIK